MSAWALPRTARGWRRRVTVTNVVLVALTAAWTFAVGCVLADYSPPVPFWALVAMLVAVGVVPLLVALALALGAGAAQPLLRPLGAWIGLVSAATVAALVAAAAPVVALAIPAVLLSAVVLARHRVATVVLAFAFAGSFGSLTAFTPLPVGGAVDVLLGSLVLGAIWHRIASTSSTRVIVWPGVVVLGVFLFVSALGVVLAPTLQFGLLAFRSAAWYLLAFVVIAYLPWRPGDLARAARGVVVVAAVVAGYAVLRWIIGPAPQEWSLAISSASIYNFVEGKLRAFGSFTSGHELGAWTASIVPFCVAYALANRNRYGAIAATAAVLGTVALLGSEVRIGLLAVAVGVAVVLALFQVSRGFAGLHLGATALLVAMTVGVGAGAFVAVLGDDGPRADRFANILTPERDPAYQARLVKWRTALAVLDEKPAGHGLGTAGRVQRNGRFVSVATYNVDNAYLKMAWEQGYVMLFVYVVGVLLLLWGLARRAVLTRDPTKAGLAIGASGTLASFLVLLFAALYDEGLTALAAWIIVGIGAGQFTRPSAGQSADEYA